MLNKKSFFKSNKGFTEADIVIALVIIVLFAGIVVTGIYNIYLIETQISYGAEATQYIISALEYSDKINYEEVTKASIEKYLENIDLPGEYTKEVVVTNYNEEEQNKDKQNIIKKVKVAITYNIHGQEEKIEITKLKIKEF